MRRAVLLAITIAALLCGCSHNMMPSADRNFEPIPEFSSTKAINLVNGQPADGWVKFASAGIGHTFNANYHDWTDVAIQITSRELKKRDMSITGDAPKVLTLSVESASFDQGFIELRYRILMRARASDGYSRVYTGENMSAVAGGPEYLLSGAMMRAVNAMLSDPRMVAFLKQ